MQQRRPNYLREVREQYEDLPFPSVDPIDETWRLQVMPQDSLHSINHYCFGGKRNFYTEPFRVLVAGGGTGHALIYLAEQLRGTPAEILYVDLSEKSMATAQERARIRELDNIQWHQGSLLDLPRMGLEPFDYINCTGVLHHLSNPTAGLMALASVLKPDGAMGLMLYALYGRRNVYHVQTLMKLLEVNRSPFMERIELTKLALRELPNHFFGENQAARDGQLEAYFADDANLFDTFLHSHDQAYTVPEVYELLEATSLEMNGFTHFHCTMTGKLSYIPEVQVRDPELLRRVMQFPQERREAISELFHGRIDLHSFYASYKTARAASVRDLDMVPFPCQYYLGTEAVLLDWDGQWLAERLLSREEESVTFAHPVGLELALSPTRLTPYLFRYLDGERSTGEIIEAALQDPGLRDAPPSREELLEEFCSIFAVFNSIDWFQLRHKSLPPYRSYLELQEPISELWLNKLG